MARRTQGVLIVVALAIAGCGSSVTIGRDGHDHVPGNKRISDLTPTERDQLCDDVTAWAMTGPSSPTAATPPRGS